MQSRRRSRPSRLPGRTVTGSFWRRPSLGSPHLEQTPGDRVLAPEKAIVEHQALQAQVTVAAVFVAISAGIFYFALRAYFLVHAP